MRAAAVYILLFLAVLVTPFTLRQPSAALPTEPGGVESLVIVTPNNTDICREFSRAFSAWHVAHYGTPVTLDVRAISGTPNIRRMLQTSFDAVRLPDHSLPPEETIGDTIDIQIAWSGGNSFFENELKPLGILAPLHLTKGELKEVFPQPTLGGVALYDQQYPPKWVGGCLSSFGIIYNSDLYTSAGLTPPRTWADLAEPRLFGMVGLADPTHSASVGVCYMMVIQRAMADAEAAYWAIHPGLKDAGYQVAISDGFRRGMGELLLIAANARYFVDSSPQPPTDVADGQAAVAMAIDFYAYATAAQVGRDRARFVLPPNATAVTPDPVAILYGTVGRKRELADHFVEFLLSREGQLVWILNAGAPGGPRDRALRRPPIRRDVYDGDRTNWSADADPFTAIQTFNMRGAWMGLFADLNSIWAAAWIDDREGLLAARRAIAAVHNPEERRRLFDDLAAVPLTMQDVQIASNERKEREAAGNADLWKAQERIHWAKVFADHYRRVEAEAELAL